jgi:hypothetical protein
MSRVESVGLNFRSFIIGFIQIKDQIGLGFEWVDLGFKIYHLKVIIGYVCSFCLV